MSIIEKLHTAGSKISNRPARFDGNRTEIEFWIKRDSAAMRQFLAILIRLHPEFIMRRVGGPPSRGMGVRSTWISPSYDPYLLITLDSRDCPEYNTRSHMPLGSLLAQIQDQGPVNAMAFHISLDSETYDRMLALEGSSQDVKVF